ncbi:MAG TPA: hypothetical protein VJU15_05970 [Gemmatimonadales bacterium]|nr:hypothetical protein [Gemmatimonadales bacterium]
MTSIAAPLAVEKAATSTGRFYVRMAWVCLAIAVIGFLPTYWIPLVRGTFAGRPIVHLHALAFYGWTLFFVSQASLVSRRRVARHRELGVVGVAIATSLLFIGLAVAISALRASLGGSTEAAVRRFTIVPVSGILLFATLVTVALVNVRRADVHKRLLLVATAAILQASVGRLFVLAFAPPPGPGPRMPPPVPITIPAGIVVDLLIIAGMIYDKRTRGKVHPAYWLGGAAVLAVQVLVAPLSGTSAWLRVTDWILAMAR